LGLIFICFLRKAIVVTLQSMQQKPSNLHGKNNTPKKV